MVKTCDWDYDPVTNHSKTMTQSLCLCQWCNEGQQVLIKGGTRNMCYLNQGDEPYQGQTNAGNQSELQDIKHIYHMSG